MRIEAEGFPGPALVQPGTSYSEEGRAAKMIRREGPMRCSAPSQGHSSSPLPLSDLLSSIRALRALAIEPSAATELLGSKVEAAARAFSELMPDLQIHGWSPAEARFLKTVDVHGLISCLQKFKYQKLNQLGSGSFGECSGLGHFPSNRSASIAGKGSSGHHRAPFTTLTAATNDDTIASRAGVVHRARDRETGEVLAIKKLKYSSSGSGLADATIREIAALRELHHENIVQ